MCNKYSDIGFEDYNSCADDTINADGTIRKYKIYLLWILHNSYNNLLIGSGCYGQHFLYQINHNLNIIKRNFMKQTNHFPTYITVSSVQSYTGNYLFTSWQMKYIMVYDCNFNLLYHIYLRDDDICRMSGMTMFHNISSICSDLYGNIYTMTDRNPIINKYNEKGVFTKSVDSKDDTYSNCICQYKSQIISLNVNDGLLKIYDTDLHSVSNHKIHAEEKNIYDTKCYVCSDLLYIKYKDGIRGYDMRKIRPGNNEPIDIINVNSDPSNFTIIDGRLLISDGDRLYYH